MSVSTTANDRAPTLDEIQKIIEYPDRRSFSSFAIWESRRKKPSIITTINLELYFIFIF